MRIRSIRPEFWSSDDIAKHSWETRLIFIGLWSYVDDNGVGRDVPKLIVADLLALEDDPHEALMQITRALMQLKNGGQICRYEVDSRPFLHICKWDTHQVISRPSKSRYPSLTCADAINHPNTHVKDMSPHVNVPHGEGEKGRRGEGEKGKELSRKTGASEIDIADNFNAFWDAYGKKVDRGKALRAFKGALKKVDATTLITAAGEHAEWHRREGTEPRFIKHPTSWLNAECWADERTSRNGSSRDPKQAATDDLFDAAMRRAVDRERNSA